MKANEIKDMTVDELNSKLAELKQELFNLSFPARCKSVGES